VQLISTASSGTSLVLHRVRTVFIGVTLSEFHIVKLGSYTRFIICWYPRILFICESMYKSHTCEVWEHVACMSSW